MLGRTCITSSFSIAPTFVYVQSPPQVISITAQQTFLLFLTLGTVQLWPDDRLQSTIVKRFHSPICEHRLPIHFGGCPQVPFPAAVSPNSSAPPKFSSACYSTRSNRRSRAARAIKGTPKRYKTTGGKQTVTSNARRWRTLP